MVCGVSSRLHNVTSLWAPVKCGVCICSHSWEWYRSTCNLECVLVLHERTKTVQIPKIFFDLSTWIEFGSIFPIFSKMRAKADTTFYRRSKLRFGGGEKRLISCFYQPPPRAAKNALLEAETNHYKPWKSRLERVFCNIFDGFSRASVHSQSRLERIFWEITQQGYS